MYFNVLYPRYTSALIVLYKSSILSASYLLVTFSAVKLLNSKLVFSGNGNENIEFDSNSFGTKKLLSTGDAVSYTHLTLPTNREV